MAQLTITFKDGTIVTLITDQEDELLAQIPDSKVVDIEVM